MNKRLVLLPIIEQISKVQVLGKKALQKLIYLIQRKGLDLGFDYSIHYYGPYSSTLDYSVQSLEMQGAIEMNVDGLTWRIHTTGMSGDLAEESGYNDFGEPERAIIGYIVENFAGLSAKQLELLTTTDYVANKIGKERDTPPDTVILDGVKRIKDDKFSDEEIIDAIHELRKHGFIN